MKFISFNVNKKSKIFKIFSLTIMLSILAYFVIFSNSNFEISQNILAVFLKIVMPSLFPFILFSNILIYSGYFKLFKETKLCQFLAWFFKISKNASLSVIFGFLFGYPNGAKFVNEQYEKGEISRNEAEYLLSFINNSSPAFILSSVGIGMFGNIKIGILLLFSHIGASVVIGKICAKKFGYINSSFKESKEEINYCFSFETISKSITKTFVTMGMIFGFMTIFTLLNNMLLTLFRFKALKSSSFAKSILLSILEMTGGLNLLIKENLSFKLLLMLTSGILGFSSLSIIFQIYSSVYINGFKLQTILKGKILHGIFSSIITYILINVPYIYNFIDSAKNVNYKLFEVSEKTKSYFDLSVLVITILISIYLAFCITLKKKRLNK